MNAGGVPNTCKSNEAIKGSFRMELKLTERRTRAIEVEAAQKMQLIQELCVAGIDIVGVDSKKPSLEEIFYQIKE
jgi:hypothetical protein